MRREERRVRQTVLVFLEAWALLAMPTCMGVTVPGQTLNGVGKVIAAT